MRIGAWIQPQRLTHACGEIGELTDVVFGDRSLTELLVEFVAQEGKAGRVFEEKNQTPAEHTGGGFVSFIFIS